MRRHALSDQEWTIIEPLPPTNSRGMERVDDRRAVSGILWLFRTGSVLAGCSPPDTARE